MIWPVYIPSKGRAETITTARVLREGGVQAVIVAEPQEQAAYRLNNPLNNLLVLPQNNGGIVTVRNHILEHAKAAGHAWFWMMDDDIKGFYLVEQGKTHKRVAHAVLAFAQGIIEEQGEEAAQAALEYQQYAWAAKTPYKTNSYCDVCVAVAPGRVGHVRYRRELALKEDRDFTLQLLNSGKRVVRVTHAAFTCPKNGSNKGGLHAEYAQAGREAAASLRMQAAWPGVCEAVTKPDGRQDVKIHWAKAYQKS